MVRLYRNTNFSHLLGSRWVEVMTGSVSACEARAAELEAKGFLTFTTEA